MYVIMICGVNIDKLHRYIYLRFNVNSTAVDNKNNIYKNLPG